MEDIYRENTVLMIRSMVKKACDSAFSVYWFKAIVFTLLFGVNFAFAGESSSHDYDSFSAAWQDCSDDADYNNDNWWKDNTDLTYYYATCRNYPGVNIIVMEYTYSVIGGGAETYKGYGKFTYDYKSSNFYRSRKDAVNACYQYWASNRELGYYPPSAFTCEENTDGTSHYIQHVYEGGEECVHQYRWNTVPVLTIKSPITNSEFNVGVSVPFSASAVDAEDGNISSKIVWRSSINGKIGTGASFSKSNLSAGTHVITATVSDTSGESSSGSITITVSNQLTISAWLTNGGDHQSYESVTMSASAAVNGVDKSSNIQWTSNLQSGVLATGANVSLTNLVPGTHLITATITEGSASKQTTLTVNITPNKPKISLTRPMGGLIYDINTAISFAASGTYRGVADNAPIVWTSSIDGQIGTGGSFSKSTLSEGTHTITASLTENGYTDSASISLTVYDREKNLGDEKDGQCFGGNPINILTGNKFQEETDFVLTTETPLYLKRVYNSQSFDSGFFGVQWHSNFEQRIKLSTNGLQAAVVNETGGVQRFTLKNSVWTDTSSSEATLVRNTDGSWTYALYDGTSKSFSSNGKITSINYPSGQALTFTYVSGVLNSVSDSFGNSIGFTFNTDGTVSGVTDNAGNLYSYTYSNGNLKTVVYPDDTPTNSADNPYKEYMYEDTRFTHALTGIVDEERNRFATWRYDALGRASHSEHAGEETYDITYGGDQSSTTTNQFGRQTIYRFKSIKGILKITNVEGQASPNCSASFTQTKYDPTTGFANEFTDRKGIKTSLIYNSFGQLTDSTTFETGYGWANASGSITLSKRYDTSNRLWKIIKPGLTVERLYNLKSRIKTVTETDTTSNTAPYSTNGVARVTSYTYELYTGTSNIKKVTIDGPRTDVNDLTVLQYDAAGNLVSTTNAKGQVVSFANFNKLGLPDTKTDENGIVTNFTYYTRGWLHTSTTHLAEGDAKTEFTYYKNGLVKTKALASGYTETYTYNAAHQLTGVTNSYGESQVLTPSKLNGDSLAAKIYNSSSQLRYDQFSSQDELGRKTSTGFSSVVSEYYLYDNENHLARTTVTNYLKNIANGSITSYYYDAYGRQRASIPSDGAPVFFGYDAYGNRNQVLIAGSTASGPTLQWKYDQDGNLVPGVSPASRSGSYFDFDATGTIVGVQSGSTGPDGQLTTYVYDGFGDVIYESSPTTGTATKRYDLAGNLTSVTYGSGLSITYSYDELNRRLSEQYSDSTLVSFGYDDTTDSFGVGHLTSITDVGTKNRSISYKYADVGRAKNISYKVPYGTSNANYRTKQVSYTFKNFGAVATTTYNGETLEYKYDNFGRATGLKASGSLFSNDQLVSDASYEPFGPLKEFTLGNGAKQSFSHDSAYRTSNISSDFDYGSESINYVLDSSGFVRRSSLTNADGAEIGAKIFSLSGYGRLKNVGWQQDSGVPLNPARTYIGYSYDSYGNRIGQSSSDDRSANATAIPFETRTITVDRPNNQLKSMSVASGAKTTSTAYSYSGLGDLSGDGSTTYQYNERHRLTDVLSSGTRVLQNVYNQLGQRIEKIDLTKQAGNDSLYWNFVYGADNELLFETKAANSIRTYVYFAGRPVAMYGGAPLYDNQESTQQYLIFNNSQKMVSSAGAETFNGNAMGGDGDFQANLSRSGVAKLGSSYLGLSIRESISNPLSDGISVRNIHSSPFVMVGNGGYTLPVPTKTGASDSVEVTVISAGVSTKETINIPAQWFKLSKAGNYTSLYSSSDGVTWTLYKSYYLPLISNTYAGYIARNYSANTSSKLKVANDSLFYFATDKIGSPYALTSRNKTKVWQRKDFNVGASPFGDDSLFDGSSLYSGLFEQPLRFPGQYYDSETGLTQNLNRDYSASSGRYLQADPLGISQGGNLYTYAANNPLVNYDPKGLCLEDLCIGEALILAALYSEEIATATIVAAEVATGVPNPVSGTISGAGTAVKSIAEDVGYTQSFNNFSAAKKVWGEADKQLHHFVEQCQANASRSGFSKQQINSTNNFINLAEDVHQKVSSYYSTNVPFQKMTFRDTMNGKSFQEQLDIGKDIVKRAINGEL